MKSPALAEALRPLRRLVTDAQARDEEHRLAQRMRVAEQKARRHELARRLREAVANQEPPEALQEPVEPARWEPPPVEERYLVNDTTVEKLGELLNDNPNGLLLFRDELSGFLSSMSFASARVQVTRRILQPAVVFGARSIAARVAESGPSTGESSAASHAVSARSMVIVMIWSPANWRLAEDRHEPSAWARG
jgi:hypothetical protein